MTDAPDTSRLLAAMQAHAHQIMAAVPWANALGFEVTRIEKGRAFARVAWREDLVGDPDTGVIHGGVVTALLDNICGVAVSTALQRIMALATLDLRIDYMRPAEMGADIIAEAECYHVTRSVAFTHAWAYHDSRERVIATASAAFAINHPGRWTAGTGVKAGDGRSKGTP